MTTRCGQRWSGAPRSGVAPTVPLDVAPGEVFDRAEYLRSNTGGTLVWRQQLVDRTAVVVLGDTGVVTCLVTDHVEVDGESRSYRMPAAQTWVREDGRWRCLAGHAGPLL